jgi:hypothetical protein
MHAVEVTASDSLVQDGRYLIGQRDHMVAVPAHEMAYVQHNGGTNSSTAAILSEITSVG